MEKSQIYTKTGDKGTTSLVGGTRISKASLQLEAYGTADELNAHLGHLGALIGSTSELGQPILQIQNHLFNVGGYLACPPHSPYYEKGCIITDVHIKFIEKEIDRIDDKLPKLNRFILPTGDKQSTQAHICRTVCRRLERHVIALSNEQEIDENVLIYINRLSDLLFVWARFLQINYSQKEIFWEKDSM